MNLAPAFEFPRVNLSSLRTLLRCSAVAAVFLWGGGASAQTAITASPQPPQTSKVSLKGAVKVLAGTSVTVCLDVARIGTCDGSNPVANVVGDSFELVGYKSKDVGINFMVAQYTALTGGSRLMLTAPALNNVRINGLSTLASARMSTAAKSPQGAYDDAYTSVVQEMSGLLVNGAVDPAGDVRVLALDNISVDVLKRAMAAFLQRPNTAAPLLTVLRSHANASVPAIAKYVDRPTGALIPTVTSRTPGSEVAGTLYPVVCTAEPASTITVDTLNAAPITTKTTYVAVTNLQIKSWDTGVQPAVYTNAAKIRGRGNYTWTLDKKPYKVKFNAATPVLGMPADTEWALLANYTDKSNLRNALAMCTARQLELGWVPRSRFVQLTLNGRFDGLYQMFEHVKTAPQRVDLGTPPATATDFEAGYLLEINFRLDETYNFVSGMNVPYSIKDGNTSDAGNRIQAEVQALEAALAAPDLAIERAYLAKLDVESLVDFYLVQELGKNWDAFNSSSYLQRARGATRISFGPVWDFDLIAGNGIAEAEGFWIDSTYPYNAAKNGIYVSKLLSDPAFRKHVVARWRYLSSKMPTLQTYLGNSAALLHTGVGNAIDANFERWPVLSTFIYPNVVALGSYDQEFEYLRQWLKTRAAWLDSHWTEGF